MALASGASGIGAEITAPEGIGAEITAPEGILLHAWLFGEDQGRYILTTADPDRVLAEAVAADIPAAVIGTTGGAETSHRRRRRPFPRRACGAPGILDAPLHGGGVRGAPEERYAVLTKLRCPAALTGGGGTAYIRT